MKGLTGCNNGPINKYYRVSDIVRETRELRLNGFAIGHIDIRPNNTFGKYFVRLVFKFRHVNKNKLGSVQAETVRLQS